jgi:hypothetical protein
VFLQRQARTLSWSVTDLMAAPNQLDRHFPFPFPISISHFHFPLPFYPPLIVSHLSAMDFDNLEELLNQLNLAQEFGRPAGAADGIHHTKLPKHLPQQEQGVVVIGLLQARWEVEDSTPLDAITHPSSVLQYSVTSLQSCRRSLKKISSSWICSWHPASPYFFLRKSHIFLLSS